MEIDANYMNHLSQYGVLSQLIEGFNTCPDKEKIRSKWLEENYTNLISTLESIRLEFQKDMFKSSLKFIISTLKCTHSLDIHKAELNFHILILATELLYKRQSRKEVIDMFDKIFASDYRNFPYPRHVKTEDEKKKYFSKKKFENAFNAIEYFLNQKIEISHVLFKIKGLNLPQDYIFKFDKVEISSIKNPKWSALREEISKMTEHVSSMFEGNYAVCLVPSRYQTFKTAMENAYTQTEIPIIFLNSQLQTSFSIDNRNFLFCNKVFKNFGYSFSRDLSDNEFNEIELEKLNDNLYFYFENFKCRSKLDFLKFEDDFIRARKTNDLSGLWRYLEVLLYEKGEDKKVKSMLAGSLLLSEQEFNIGRIESYLRRAIHILNTSSKDIGISTEDQILYAQSGYDLRSIPKIDSPFFTDMLAKCHEPLNKDKLQSIYKYYHSIMIEAYEQRNFHTHGGDYHELANIKLNITFNTMITRFRWLILDYMKKYPRITLKKIFEKIEADYKRKLDD